jgi:hypothetical protein
VTNARPTAPMQIMTAAAAGHKQIYHVAVGPKPREAVAKLAMPEPRPLAPAAPVTTTSETGLVTINNADGVFTYLNGLPHSEGDAPSHRRTDGSLAWYHHGEPHRFGGPSSTDPDGSESWYAFGQLHRDGGPAVTHRNGDVEYHVRGMRFESAKAADKATAEQLAALAGVVDVVPTADLEERLRDRNPYVREAAGLALLDRHRAGAAAASASDPAGSDLPV